MSSSQIKLTAISVADLAKLLKQAGSRFASEATIRKDIDAGAPVNSDGTVNLIHYTSWLIREGVNQHAN